MYDHGNDPVIVENVPQYPPGVPPPGPGPHLPRPPPGHINMGLPPPGFFSNRMGAPPIHVRPGNYSTLPPQFQIFVCHQNQ